MQKKRKMLKIFRNGVNRSIGVPSKIVNSCILIRSASTQISSQKCPWARQPPSPTPPSASSTVKPSLSYLQFRCYSIDSDDPPKQQIADTERKIPKMSNEQLHIGAPFFSFLVLNFKALKIRRYDADFSINEFVEGSKKAVEVCLDQLMFLFSRTL